MKDVSVETVEEFIQNYKALPPEMLGWRYYRLEYHHPEHIYAIHECGIFCPPWLDRDALEKLFERPPEWADWEPEL